MSLQCLNPIIAYVKGYHPEKVTGEKKMTLSGFQNFVKYNKIHGNQASIDLLKRDDVILLPCRKCTNCKLKRRREWAIRNTLESRECNSSSLFLTLTYDDVIINNNKNFALHNVFIKDLGKYIPVLCYRDVQLFFKRFREHFKNYNIRFFLGAEYGSQTYRPHYHICLYGLPLEAIQDLDLLYTRNKNNYYRSDTIDKLWSLGFVNITIFSEYTAMYVAGYTAKKSSFNYCFANSWIPEFNRQSLKPGIGSQYFINHKDDIYKNDEFIYHIPGKSFSLKPVKYFDRLYDVENPAHFKFIKDNRKKFYKQYEYFENLETDLSIAEYLYNEESLNIKKMKERKLV